MKTIQKLITCFAILMISPFSLISQKYAPEDHLELIYLHTDRPLYFPGETIWFKAYITDAGLKPSNISDIVYVELIAPNGEKVKTHKLPVSEGSAYSDFFIDADKPGGIYTFRAYTNWMKNFGSEGFVERKLMVQKIVKPKLLMKLDFEKEAFGKGSDVTAKLELKDLKNEALGNTKIEYILNISGKKYLSGNLLTTHEGKADIKFSLPGTLSTSDLILNILIPYKGSTEAISRSVPVILDNIDLQFLPEGGYLLAGAENTIAFKALNEFGKPADIEIEIWDEKSGVVAKAESFHDGMGEFRMYIEAGKKYEARIIKPFVSDMRYALPTPRETGLILHLEKNENQVLAFQIFSKEKARAFLLAKTAGSQLLQTELNLTSGWNECKVPVGHFPIGIAEFTLMDKYNGPQQERLVFINKNKDLKIQVKTNKTQYAPREKIEVEIITTNLEGKPVASDLSIAVTDDKIISFANDKQDNILSGLLMASVLKGKIEKPNFYFDPKEEKAEKALDLVMLTNGWRTFIFDKKLVSANTLYQPEKKFTEFRTVLDMQNKPVKATVFIIEQYNSNKLIKTETDETGIFSFKRQANKDYLIMAYTRNNQLVSISKNYIPKTVLDKKSNSNDKSTNSKQSDKPIGNKENARQEKEEPVLQGILEQKGSNSENKELKTTVENPSSSQNQSGINALVLESSVMGIDEVVVVGYGVMAKREITSSSVSVNVEEISTFENISNSLQGRVPGIEITRDNPGAGENIKIYGTRSLSANNEPLFVIDGIVVSNLPGTDVLSLISPNDIQSVEVLKDNAATSIYGHSAANGAIVINTYRGNFVNAKSFLPGKVKHVAIENYSHRNAEHYETPRQFYMPVYDSKKPVHTRNDFRNTIYWNPVVQTDENGKSTFSFYNSDAITSYRIVAEGIGHNGLPGRKEETFSIQKPLSIDAKVPAYLSLGDTLEIPLIVSNNTDKELLVKIDFALPTELKLAGKFQDNVFLGPNSGNTQHLKVVPVQETKYANIAIGLKTEGLSDNFNQQIAIVSPLFPKRLSFSGNRSGAFNFPFNDKAAPGSVSANFTLYLDIIGDVMNGIESIMREPSGCFEQVSSTAYPNVLVLKYLRETGKLNPELEIKAMQYIHNGYRKLAAYETREGGFEWYGGMPPHEVLSAYGIMQFLEMKEVYAGVDDKMIKRTIDWLLARRDGKGGFRQNNGRYGFSGAPKNVNNAYIVYAMSHLAKEANLEDEYRVAYQEALETKDNYRMALMALASHNLNQADNYKNMVNLLVANIDWSNLTNLFASYSITYSYGSSLKVETASFIALAFMKGNVHNDYTAKLIDFILKNRQYGRFGNTQATAMALKALIDYNRLQKTNRMLAGNNQLVLKINGKEVHVKIEADHTGMMHVPGIEKYLGAGLQHVEVLFADESVSIPYSLDINWKAVLPASAGNCPLDFKTTLAADLVRTGETARMEIGLKNCSPQGLPMTVAIVGIPSGLSVQMWQLKELQEKQVFDYFEIMNNYIVLYWREMGPQEAKTIALDLKAEVPGNYKAAASSAYLYYADENKIWIEGTNIQIQ
jgi:alpha-2-macroglobulin-like protein